MRLLSRPPLSSSSSPGAPVLSRCLLPVPASGAHGHLTVPPSPARLPHRPPKPPRNAARRPRALQPGSGEGGEPGTSPSPSPRRGRLCCWAGAEREAASQPPPGRSPPLLGAQKRAAVAALNFCCSLSGALGAAGPPAVPR